MANKKKQTINENATDKNEDLCRSRVGHTAQSFSVIRKIVLNILKYSQPKNPLLSTLSVSAVNTTSIYSQFLPKLLS